MAIRREAGNGDYCPVWPEHGRMFMLPSGRQYCSHQRHDVDKTPAKFEHDGVTPFTRMKVVVNNEEPLAELVVAQPVERPVVDPKIVKNAEAKLRWLRKHNPDAANLIAKWERVREFGR